VLMVLVAWCIVQVCIALGLGTLGQLHLRAVLLAEMAASTIILASPAARRRLGALVASPLSLAWPDRLVSLALGIVGLTLLVQLAVRPITDYDSLAYHLPRMAQWYQARALPVPELELGVGRFGRQVSRYPFGWELLCTLFLLPFGEDFLVALPNLLAWLMLGVAIYLVAMEFGARRLLALTGAFLVLATPVARRSVNTMHVDLSLAAFFMAGLYFAFSHRAGGSLLDAALCIGAVGMLIGTKTSGPAYGAVLMATLFAPGRRRALARPIPAMSAVGFAALSILAGASWYARNLIEVGNPLGYVRVALGNRTILPGFVEPAWLDGTTVGHLFDPTRARHWKILGGAVREQLGLPFVLIVLLALGLLRPQPWVRIAAHRGRVVGLLAVALATGLLYCTTPFSGAPWPPPRGELGPWSGQAIRYALPFLGVLGVLGALGGTHLVARGGLLAPISAVLVLTGAMTGTMALVTPVVLTAHAASGCVSRLPRAARMMLCCALVAVLADGAYALRAKRDAARAREYGGVGEFLAEHASADRPVGCLLSHRSYLFYGKHFTTKVAYVAAGTEDRDAWVAHLRRDRIEMVAIGPLRPKWRSRAEVAWLSDGSGPFVRVFGTDEMQEPVVYRLRSTEQDTVANRGPPASRTRA